MWERICNFCTFTDKNYYKLLHHDTGRTWQAARNECRSSLGAGWDLPSAGTPDIIPEIAKVLDPPSLEYYLGAHQSSVVGDGEWQWTDGTDWRYNVDNDSHYRGVWANGRPNTDDVIGFGAVGGRLGGWRVVQKEENHETVVTVCQKSKI